MSTLALLTTAFVTGVLTSASPCVLAAVPITVGFVGSRARSRREAALLSLTFVLGMTLAFTVLGLAAARLGMFFGALGGTWTLVVGMLIVAFGVWLLVAPADRCGISLPPGIQARLKGSGIAGAATLGALTGTIMTPCATPALAAALSIAGTGGVLGGSMWLGAGMLLAYGIGHSALLLAAGIAPASIQTGMRRLGLERGSTIIRPLLAGLVMASGFWLAWTAISEWAPR